MWKNDIKSKYMFMLSLKKIARKGLRSYNHVFVGSNYSYMLTTVEVTVWMINYSPLFLLTHWGRDKMAVIFQMTYSNAFSWMKMYEFRLRFHWRLFLGVQSTIFQHWFRQWLGAVQATSHYLKQWWPSLLMPQWVNVTTYPYSNYMLV